MLFRSASREATDHHQFGYGRVRYLYGFVVAIVLFLVGGAYSIYEGWHKIHDPHPVENTAVAVAILAVAVVLESLSFRTALRETNKARGHRSLVRFVRDAREPELPVILLEDLGALVGLVLALVGVTAAVATGDGRWDGMGAISIGVLLVVIAVVLVREMASMLVGEAALPEEEEQVRAAIESAPLDRKSTRLNSSH